MPEIDDGEYIPCGDHMNVQLVVDHSEGYPNPYIESAGGSYRWWKKPGSSTTLVFEYASRGEAIEAEKRVLALGYTLTTNIIEKRVW